MIHKITESIASKFTISEVWAKVYQFVEPVTSADGKTVPAEYTSKGNYKAIEYDKFKGIIYTRLNGDVRLQESELTSNPCKGATEMTFPMRSVSVIKKEFSPDECFADDYFGNKIVSLINKLSLSSVDGIRRTTVNVESIKHGNQTLVNEEYDGYDKKDFPLQYSYVAVDYSVVVIANLDCLTQLCESYG